MANNQVADIQQKFLDANQYSQLSISRYERIFGRTFVSTGGEQTTKVHKKNYLVHKCHYINISTYAYNN